MLAPDARCPRCALRTWRTKPFWSSATSSLVGLRWGIVSIVGHPWWSFFWGFLGWWVIFIKQNEKKDIWGIRYTYFLAIDTSTRELNALKFTVFVLTIHFKEFPGFQRSLWGKIGPRTTLPPKWLKPRFGYIYIYLDNSFSGSIGTHLPRIGFQPQQLLRPEFSTVKPWHGFNPCLGGWGWGTTYCFHGSEMPKAEHRTVWMFVETP